MGYYEIKQIYPWLYSLKDPGNVYCYLLIGNEKALLFDTAYGIGSLPDAVRTVSDKPLTVVLGHGHVDHANGAYQFEEAWLHEGDFGLCRKHTSETFKEIATEGRTLPEGFNKDAYMKSGAGSLKKLEPGRIFDLGGLHVEVIPMEGHTAGSVGLLAAEHRVLLDSDAANDHVWMFLEESLPVSQYIHMLERTVLLDFDTFFVGHSDNPLPKSDFLKYVNAAKNISLKNSKPYNAFQDLEGFLYEEDGAGIVFNAAKLT